MSPQAQVKEAMPGKRGDPEPQQLYGRSLFDAELRTSRKLLISTLLLPIVYTSLLMWACLSLYWGSTTYTSLQKLSVHAIDLDGGTFGHQMIAGLKKSAQNSREGLDGNLTSLMGPWVQPRTWCWTRRSGLWSRVCFAPQPLRALANNTMQSVHLSRRLSKQHCAPIALPTTLCPR